MNPSPPFSRSKDKETKRSFRGISPLDRAPTFALCVLRSLSLSLSLIALAWLDTPERRVTSSMSKLVHPARRQTFSSLDSLASSRAIESGSPKDRARGYTGHVIIINTGADSRAIRKRGSRRTMDGLESERAEEPSTQWEPSCRSDLRPRVLRRRATAFGFVRSIVC